MFTAKSGLNRHQSVDDDSRLSSPRFFNAEESHAGSHVVHKLPLAAKNLDPQGRGNLGMAKSKSLPSNDEHTKNHFKNSRIPVR